MKNEHMAFGKLFLLCCCCVLIFSMSFSPSFAAEGEGISVEINVEEEGVSSLQANATTDVQPQQGGVGTHTLLLWAFVLAVILGSLSSRGGRKKVSAPAESS